MKKAIALTMMLLIGLFFAGCGKTRLKAGDTVTFGSWGGETIEWQVLEVKEDGSCILLSVKGLDSMPYHAEKESVAWETCTLRTWLNGAFYDMAFSAAEKSRILPITLENPGNEYFSTPGGNTTEDRIFLLSIEEVGRYFSLDPYSFEGCGALICMPGQEALDKNAWTVDEAYANSYSSDYDYPLKAGACWWWLRSPGSEPDCAADVDYDGSVGILGDGVNAEGGCVRPAVCVRF